MLDAILAAVMAIAWRQRPRGLPAALGQAAAATSQLVVLLDQHRAGQADQGSVLVIRVAGAAAAHSSFWILVLDVVASCWTFPAPRDLSRSHPVVAFAL
jgi:hypothetical protein